MVKEKKSVLIIEDNFADFFLFSEYMNDVNIDVNIIHASRLDEAQSFLKEKQNNIFIIFSDLNLPDAIGVEIINGIDKINLSKHPIIFLTGHPQDISLNKIKSSENAKLMLKDELNSASLKDIFFKLGYYTK